MENAISSLQPQHTSSIAASMKSGAAAQDSPQAQKLSASAQPAQQSAFGSVTYSSKGRVESISAQAAANAGFEAVV